MSLSGAKSYGLSFLQAITNNSHCGKDRNTENDKVYVHPHVKRSSLKLSEESLRMCTESLGSESGNACTESNIDELTLFSVVSENGPSKQTSKLHGFRVMKKLNHSLSFPPPLKSISCSTGVQVKSHREEGRLVLKAFTVPSCRGLFHSERGGGRLRIRMVQDEGIGEDIDEEVVEEAAGAETEAAEEELEEAEVGDEEEERNGITVGFGAQTAIGRLPRPSRCMEGGRGNKALLYLEPFWVAAHKLSV